MNLFSKFNKNWIDSHSSIFFYDSSWELESTAGIFLFLPLLAISLLTFVGEKSIEQIKKQETKQVLQLNNINKQTNQEKQLLPTLVSFELNKDFYALEKRQQQELQELQQKHQKEIQEYMLKNITVINHNKNPQ